MTKKELLESRAFTELPDDAEIVFCTSKHVEARVPLTLEDFWFEKRCTNLEYYQTIPKVYRDKARLYHKHFIVINAMPISFMKEKLNMTFDL